MSQCHIWFDPINKRFVDCHDDPFMGVIANIFKDVKNIKMHFSNNILDFFDFFVYSLTNDWILLSEDIDDITILGKSESIRKNWKYLWVHIELIKKINIQEAIVYDIPKYDPILQNDEDLYFHVTERGRYRTFFMPRDKHILKTFIQLL